MLRKMLVPVVLALVLSTSPGFATTARYGHTDARSGVLKPGCHNYRYHWVIKNIPDDGWMIETFLVDPDRQMIASGAFGAPVDAKQDRKIFRFCRNVTRPGRFKIRAKLTWWEDGEKQIAWMKPSYFRLKRPR
ncbi:hypothetical protein [Nocardioides sp.]|uniref:hypothetical protein n=1 Tax=Nocardioides sp. TaxID=35761 RepID=UPI003564F644